jgi:hypothetical protein
MGTNLDLFFKDCSDNMVRLDIKNNLFYLASADEISVYQLTNELLGILPEDYLLTTEEDFKIFTQNIPVGYVSHNIIFDRHKPLSLLFSQSQFASC